MAKQVLKMPKKLKINWKSSGCKCFKSCPNNEDSSFRFFLWDLYHYILRVLQAILSLSVAIMYFFVVENTDVSEEVAFTCMVPLLFLRIPKSPKENVHVIIHVYTAVLSSALYGVLSLVYFGDFYNKRKTGLPFLALVICTSTLTLLSIVDGLITNFYNNRPILPPPFFRSFSVFSKSYSIDHF
ncbi:uncharacterized protein LOC106673114 [Cimex lectularius]|uniref:Uncharacterized protein n=1 Tax=Cimex lectularius TaxID=79782 RepID=A0A8I6SCB3_CIMLE|nr:uncharacterized protein LOC106673114 [Cimex lectularius]